MQKILIVIDMQNDFVTGPLGSKAAQVAAHINEYDTVIFTRDTHGPDHLGKDNLLQPVFRDGSMIKEDTLHDIRARLYKEGF